MAGELPQVIFVNGCSGVFYVMGSALSQWMRSQPCEVWEPQTDIEDWSLVSKYDLGINFLGTRKIPASEVGNGRRWVNFHPAPLPEYGGRNVAYHAIMEGAKEFGATVHYMSPEFDTGDIIECVRFPIRPADTAGDLMTRAKVELVDMFKNWVPKLLQGPVPAVSQEGKTKYYRQQRIDDYIPLMNYIDVNELSFFEKRIRALTCPPHSAKIMIAGKNYKIIPEDV